MEVKTVVLILVVLFLVPVTAYAKGEWSEWIILDSQETWKPSIKRIYDHENKLVCWISTGGGISCYPSLELEHPMFQKQ